jgi:ornithine decarboxylase
MTTVLFERPEHGQPYRELVAEHGSPVMLIDAQRLRAAYRALELALPGVALHYAVKSFPEPAAVRILSEDGARFDLASRGEIALVQSVGVDARRTIHTHPVKTDQDIRATLRYGCTTFVVDNGFEIQKFVRYRHRVGLLLRVSFPNPGARVDLSRKFGCDMADVPQLLRHAEQLGLHIKGMSFHVGSQCDGPQAHVAAINACVEVMDGWVGETPMSVLDIGGGFPVDYSAGEQDPAAGIDAFCAPIREVLRDLPPGVEILAEPGRCISGPAVSLVCSVVGKAERGGKQWFYLDDGVYGAFSGQIYDGACYPLTFFAGEVAHENAILAGPTCDSIDVIRESVPTPDFGLGDIVLARQMGAYTSASASEFNSIPRAPVVVINDSQADAARPRLTTER